MIKSGIRFLGISPFFKWTILSLEKYWLFVADDTFLTEINHPTNAITILSQLYLHGSVKDLKPYNIWEKVKKSWNLLGYCLKLTFHHHIKIVPNQPLITFFFNKVKPEQLNCHSTIKISYIPKIKAISQSLNYIHFPFGHGKFDFDSGVKLTSK